MSASPKTREQRLQEALQELRDEAVRSVEYSDWPELQRAVRKADKALRS